MIVRSGGLSDSGSGDGMSVSTLPFSRTYRGGGRPVLRMLRARLRNSGRMLRVNSKANRRDIRFTPGLPRVR